MRWDNGGRRDGAVIQTVCKLVTPCSPWQVEDPLEHPIGTCGESGQVLALVLFPQSLVDFRRVTNNSAQCGVCSVAGVEFGLLISAHGSVFI